VNRVADRCLVSNHSRKKRNFTEFIPDTVSLKADVDFGGISFFILYIVSKRDFKYTLELFLAMSNDGKKKINILSSF
jgi:hypothetical protein